MKEKRLIHKAAAWGSHRFHSHTADLIQKQK